jgi:predicted XRE-type DNA-binding protein
MKMTNNVTRGSTNVFADLGFENPDEELLRAQLAIRIRDLVKGRGVTQAEAAKILRVAQPDVSAIVNGRVSGFSLERLLGFIRRLGDDVEITIRQSAPARTAGRVRLRVAS